MNAAHMHDKNAASLRTRDGTADVSTKNKVKRNITPTTNEDERKSMWGTLLNIPKFHADPTRWNKEWEKHLRTLSASDDVFPTMGRFYNKDLWTPKEISDSLERIKAELLEGQELIVDFWTDVKWRNPFTTAWLLLEEGERKRYLMKGLEEWISNGTFGEDSRALCPEITTSAMLKEGGRPYINFFETFTKGKKEAGGGLYLSPSLWWDSAKDVRLDGNTYDMAYTLLTLERETFIVKFFLTSLTSVRHDMLHGSKGMDPVLRESSFTHSLTQVLSVQRDKPIIRCENCTKTAEEIGGDVKFMICSSCRSKLDFIIHYCSRECQTADWRNHKKNCGKQKSSKQLPGTVHDPFWAHPDTPDHFRHLPATGKGTVMINSLGFGDPATAPSYSPALQRQVALLTADKEAEYYLFDKNNRPIRFVVHEPHARMAFRILRQDALSTQETKGLEALAEHMIKIMAQRPGLSREIILAQLESEFGAGLLAKVAEFEKMAAVNGQAGSSFIETMSKGLMTTMPALAKCMSRG